MYTRCEVCVCLRFVFSVRETDIEFGDLCSERRIKKTQTFPFIF